MTKSIIELIHEAKAYPIYTTHSATIERLLALHHATVIAELAGVEMPEPAYSSFMVCNKCGYTGEAVEPHKRRDGSECHYYGSKHPATYTLEQCQQAVAAAVARKNAEIKRVNADWVKCDTAYHALTAERDALRDELERRNSAAEDRRFE